MFELKNLAKYSRYMIENSNLLVVRGDIAPVIEGRHAYNDRYGITAPKEHLDATIKELLAGAALAAVSLSERESWGWSLTFEGMGVGFFVGVEPEGMICLRVVAADSEKASGMIQRQQAGLPLTQSHIIPRTQSPIDAVEQYFAEGVQIKARLGIRQDGEAVLVHALPDGDFDTVNSLGRDGLFKFVGDSIAEGKVKDAGEVLIFYECRCSEEMISGMVENMKESDRQHLFGGMMQLEVECPRCGRKYAVTRTDGSIH